MKCFRQTLRRREPSRGNGGETQKQEGPGKSSKQDRRQRASASGSSSRPNTHDVLSPPAVERKSGGVRLEEHLKSTDRKDKSRSQSRRASGTKAALVQGRGRYTRAVSFKSAGARIAIDATLRALVGLESTMRAPVNTQALRYKLLKHKQGTLFVFAIDASGSMAANRIAQGEEHDSQVAPEVVLESR